MAASGFYAIGGWPESGCQRKLLGEMEFEQLRLNLAVSLAEHPPRSAASLGIKPLNKAVLGMMRIEVANPR